ncbi:amidohydrolase family protein [Thalassobaculum litoreum]|uniref:Amidohydrolase family protein n=1 Tax=Thalassobaculum litoreum DSM 18839 TaxID=1123362 RepID=A0A8G2EYP4_9PROT|nr:amidohydrolase family protein [Thalassobaculum litoreum]SDF89114.1 Amidohydrolase family protein [Thalassobaculum litoreum DSM 18839]
MTPDPILTNGRVTTLDPSNPEAEAVAIVGGVIQAAGMERDVMPLAGPETKIVDLGNRRVIPGLNDSHTHLIRGGLFYNMELRWEGVSDVSVRGTD